MLAIAQDSNSNRYPRDGLIAHWPLQGDGKDIVGENHATLHRVNFVRDSVAGSSKVVAQWDGHESFMEVAKPASLIGGRDRLLDRPLDSSSHGIRRPSWRYPISLRCPVPTWLAIEFENKLGVTFNQSNQRHLQFHVDDHRMSDWMDRGRPATRCWLSVWLLITASSLPAPANRNSVRVAMCIVLKDRIDGLIADLQILRTP